jgi:hypothetical protein
VFHVRRHAEENSTPQALVDFAIDILIQGADQVESFMIKQVEDQVQDVVWDKSFARLGTTAQQRSFLLRT